LVHTQPQDPLRHTNEHSAQRNKVECRVPITEAN
jgi:hypothetical protein